MTLSLEKRAAVFGLKDRLQLGTWSPAVPEGTLVWREVKKRRNQKVMGENWLEFTTEPI